MAGKLEHFELNLSRLSEAADMIDKLIIRDFGKIDSEHVEQTLQKIPFGRWRHFGTENQKSLLSELGALDKMELTRSVLDLIVVSVLLDAGAGDDWKFNDNGKILMRSEGLAVATLRMFQGGMWSSVGKLQVDSIGLRAIQESDLIHWFQVRKDNPLLGVKGRLDLLHRLGRVLESQPVYFPKDVNGFARPGSLVDHLLTRQCGHAQIHVNVLWDVVMKGFGGVWPESRTKLDGVSLGDVWPCAALGLLVPFHKLSQWLTYSLMERITHFLDINFLEADKMTGLAEYRNGGLFIDLGILTPKKLSSLEPSLPSVFNQLVQLMSNTTAQLKSVNPALSEGTMEGMMEELEKSPFHKDLLDALKAKSLEQRADETPGAATDEWIEYGKDDLCPDSGVLSQKESLILGSSFPPESQVIIEWRALTVALMDRLIALMRGRLKVSPESFSFPKFFVAGSWKAGRELAKQLRPATGGPPISIDSDGTLF
ncbi:putative DUF1688 domain-containing protein [Paramicrosporidium saccamoebae]|uniref:Putative DUF1688 domain-containing protein n=1 Tax=Paramicrosporidium saccamoebae TaxID=1246581 RepID=A0A2H9TKG4_9FUNG|nr:putative DUF1688 domain-containing protein [Paramicrosporidium saccamoebae]